MEFWCSNLLSQFTSSCVSLKEAALHLLEELERALLRDVAHLAQTCHGLLACSVLLLAHNATLLGLHQVSLLQATGRVLGRAVENLGSAANCDHGSSLLSLLAILAILASNGHFIFIRNILLSHTFVQV